MLNQSSDPTSAVYLCAVRNVPSVALNLHVYSELQTERRDYRCVAAFLLEIEGVSGTASVADDVLMWVYLDGALLFCL